MKEIKVRLYAHENDCYVELWKVLDKNCYYGRYTFGDEGIWYYVCDPLGYCELDSPVPDDVYFVMCDDDGDPIARYCNADCNPLPKFETYIKNEWAKAKVKVGEYNTENMSANFWAEAWNGDTTMSINQWLLSYKDPDLYAKEIKDMYGYDENWTGCWYEHQIAWEPIPGTEFVYLGKKYQFTKVKHRHDVCGVEWYEYVCTDSPITFCEYANKDRPWVNEYGYMGNWFDRTKYGTMYDKRTARSLVAKLLQTIYPSKDKLLFIELGDRNSKWYTDYCYELSYSDVADKLLSGNLHRNYVDYLCKYIRKETKGKVYECNRGNKLMIKKTYPNIYCLV